MKLKKKENVDNKAYTYRLYPTNEQAVMINKTFGCVRFVYNRMLANRKEIYDQFKEDKEAMKQQRYALPADYKWEFEWLKEVDSLALANAQLNLQTAYQNFFRDKSIGFPKFKSKHYDRKSYTTNNQKGSIRLINDTTIRLPKLKNVRIRLHRAIPEHAVIKSATISQTRTGNYYIAILVELEKKQPMPLILTPDTVLGLDYSLGRSTQIVKQSVRSTQDSIGRRNRN